MEISHKVDWTFSDHSVKTDVMSWFYRPVLLASPLEKQLWPFLEIHVVLVEDSWRVLTSPCQCHMIAYMQSVKKLRFILSRASPRF